MPIGDYRHVVTLDAPGPPVSDPDGGWTPTWQPLDPPRWYCSIEQPAARTLESLGAGSVVAQATHLLSGRHHPGITAQTRVTFQGRTLNVLWFANWEERDVLTDVVCAEVVT